MLIRFAVALADNRVVATGARLVVPGDPGLTEWIYREKVSRQALSDRIRDLQARIFALTKAPHLDQDALFLCLEQVQQLRALEQAEH